jgi:hypothetical protein
MSRFVLTVPFIGHCDRRIFGRQALYELPKKDVIWRKMLGSGAWKMAVWQAKFMRCVQQARL